MCNLHLVKYIAAATIAVNNKTFVLSRWILCVCCMGDAKGRRTIFIALAMKRENIRCVSCALHKF